MATAFFVMADLAVTSGAGAVAPRCLVPRSTVGLGTSKGLLGDIVHMAGR